MDYQPMNRLQNFDYRVVIGVISQISITMSWLSIHALVQPIFLFCNENI